MDEWQYGRKISVVAQVVVVELAHLLVEIEAAPANGTTHVALPPTVEAFTVVAVSAGRHSRLISLPVLQQAYRAFLYVSLTAVIVHRHEDLQVAQGQSKTRTAMKTAIIAISTQSASEPERR